MKFVNAAKNPAPEEETPAPEEETSAEEKPETEI